MFNNFISDAEEAMGLAFDKFAADPVLRDAVDVLQNWAAVHRDLGRLEERASRSFLKFHKDKSRASGKEEAFSLVQAGDCLAG